MGCDIHLHVEYRRNNGSSEWRHFSGYYHQFSDRVYGVFAMLADVRNYYKLKPIEQRGFPDDASFFTKREYWFRVTDKEDCDLYDYECCRTDAERWGSEIFEHNGHEYIIGPDWHSPNWCTTNEMEHVVNTVFFKDKVWEGDYVNWLGLLGLMKGVELSGEYECRAVFWFDN